MPPYYSIMNAKVTVSVCLFVCGPISVKLQDNGLRFEEGHPTFYTEKSFQMRNNLKFTRTEPRLAASL